MLTTFNKNIQYIHSIKLLRQHLLSTKDKCSESNPESNALVLGGLDVVAFTTLAMKRNDYDNIYFQLL